MSFVNPRTCDIDLLSGTTLRGDNTSFQTQIPRTMLTSSPKVSARHIFQGFIELAFDIWVRHLTQSSEDMLFASFSKSSGVSMSEGTRGSLWYCCSMSRRIADEVKTILRGSWLHPCEDSSCKLSLKWSTSMISHRAEGLLSWWLH